MGTQQNNKAASKQRKMCANSVHQMLCVLTIFILGNVTDDISLKENF